MLIRNPIVWLLRIRRRHGYGIHSPFAYQLVTQVLYNPGRYYADEMLDCLLPRLVRWFRLRPRARMRLFFRLVNHFQPRTIAAPDLTPVEWNYLHEGCRHALIDSDIPHGEVDCLLLKHSRPDALQHLHAGSMLIIDDLQHNRSLWNDVRQHPLTRVTFDLYDVGLAFFNPKLQKQHYSINW